VAKGLATECARRYYTGGQGDFRTVTYNRLGLLLRSDDGELEHPATEALRSSDSETSPRDDSVLLPAASSLRGETYLGFDFGTSTSACSYVDSRDIQIIDERSRVTEWRELAELVTDLPYPTAAPLARYISETVRTPEQ
jgi:hypothetical protein